MRLLPTAVAATLLLLADLPTLAQPAPAPAGRPGAAPAVGPPPAAANAPAQPTSPRAIEVNDAALAPVPPAKQTLASWQQALTLISARSTNLTIAVQEIARAEGIARQALGQVLPTIEARGDLRHTFLTESTTLNVGGATLTQTSPAESTNGSARLTVTQPVLAPRAWYGVKTARLSIDAAKLSVEDSERTLIAAAADSVVSVVTAERVSEINRVGLHGALETLELTRRRERLGTGTRLDVVRAEQDVAVARANLVTGDESLRQAREALGLALGFSEPYGVEPSISLNEVEQSMRAQCSPGAADQRADVRAARIQLEIAERGVTDAKLVLAPQAEVYTELSATLHGQPVVQWSIGGLITIPIWDGGSRYGAIKAARASAAQQKARLEAATRGATLDTNQAVRAVAVAEQSRQVSEQARDLARETARLTQFAYQAGTATSFDLVESARRQREAELDLAVREFDVVKAKIAALLASASCKY
jgi:outer membrane protein TolC